MQTGETVFEDKKAREPYASHRLTPEVCPLHRKHPHSQTRMRKLTREVMVRNDCSSKALSLSLK